MVGGGGCKVIFVLNPTVVLRLGWGFDNKEILFSEGVQKIHIKFSQCSPSCLMQHYDA